jgi:hypothetical protein
MEIDTSSNTLLLFFTAKKVSKKPLVDGFRVDKLSTTILPVVLSLKTHGSLRSMPFLAALSLLPVCLADATKKAKR